MGTKDASFNRLRVQPGATVLLADFDPGDSGGLPGKEGAAAQLARDCKAIEGLQDRLYAEGKRALLLVLQGMDTSGKDGTIKHVFSETSPLGVAVTAFRAPNEAERAHDFLWRVHAACPRKGMIGVFNRSHYEDVLIARVKNLAPPEAIELRYEQINQFEKMLVENGTVVVKFMLHISKKEQKERLQARLDEPDKHWKFNPGDLDDRALWDDYQRAYEIMLSRCSTEWAPWYVVPADHKWARNAIAASLLRSVLEQMAPQYPSPDWDPASFALR